MAGRLVQWVWGSLALTLPHCPTPACLFIHPDSELRTESWMELWMGRGALTLYPQEGTSAPLLSRIMKMMNVSNQLCSTMR